MKQKLTFTVVIPYADGNEGCGPAVYFARVPRARTIRATAEAAKADGIAQCMKDNHWDDPDTDPSDHIDPEGILVFRGRHMSLI